MAKARRRYRNYRKSTRWAANIRNINIRAFTAPTNSQFQSNTVLCSNPPQSADMVTTCYTVKNIEFNGNIEIDYTTITNNQITDVIAYIMFVPQGMTVGPDYDTQHPEFILALKYYGKPQVYSGNLPFTNPIRVKTRLARKLQSGDSIILLIKGINRSQTESVPLNYSGYARWWTKSN